ncbi:DUF3099 domain-containing protein [Nocardioides bigeumensis]|uniref:DUF3099 domain-containing protein n=1 Tax=Nocardioides bigeumensis TaxID=433657 RepID=A0ABN2XYY0_9ACTN
MAGRHDSDAVRVTTAPVTAADEQRGRQRRYLISMGIRTVCFVGAVVADGWLRWVLVAAAVVLPYISVVFANTESRRDDGYLLDDPGRPDTRPQLMPGSERPDPS